MAESQTWEKRKQRMRNGELLDVLRERTAMYIGERKLSNLYGFLHGWDMALSVYNIDAPRPLAKDFHDWVAYRLHFSSGTPGYKRMILERIPDEYAAVDRFYELLDEYRMRQPKVVARLNGYQGRGDVTRCQPDGTRVPVERPPLPYTLTLITYTDDPGFFVTYEAEDHTVRDSGTFYPVLKWFESDFKVERGQLEVVDPEVYDRWVREDEEYQERLRK